MLAGQDWERFDRVMAPKIAGTWHLHDATRLIPLDFFVLFSSAASLMGSAGQSNYAAANAFMDGMAHYRASLNLPALSINWGPWSEVGMAAALSEQLQQRQTGQGIGLIGPKQGLEALEQLLDRSEAQVSVLPVDDWDELVGAGVDTVPTLFQELVESTSGVASQTQKENRAFLEKVLETPSADRRAVLLEFVAEHVRRVLLLDPSQDLAESQPIGELGLDSLMATELRNSLDLGFGAGLSLAMIVEGPAIGELCDALLASLESPEASALTPLTLDEIRSDPGGDDTEEINLSDLSDQEVDALLGELLN